MTPCLTTPAEWSGEDIAAALNRANAEALASQTERRLRHAPDFSEQAGLLKEFGARQTPSGPVVVASDSIVFWRPALGRWVIA